MSGKTPNFQFSECVKHLTRVVSVRPRKDKSMEFDQIIKPCFNENVVRRENQTVKIEQERKLEFQNNH